MKTINDIAKAIVTEATEAVNIAKGMIDEAEANARAEAEARHHTDCRNCQAGFVNWRIHNPTATHTEAEEAHAQIWEQCPACVEEYKAWCEEVDRKAEEAELARLGLDYAEELNANPYRFIGGAK